MSLRIITRRQATLALRVAVRRLIWGTVRAVAWLALLASILYTSHLILSL
jgi:hypothetical protein